MDSATGSEVAVDLSPIVRIYKDGRVERLMGNDAVPAGFDDKTGVESKDVVVSPETGVSVRIYIPVAGAGAGESRRLPVLVFFHGGGFVIGRAAAPDYQNYMNILVAGAQIVAVPVEYRRAPEHPLPAAYDDSWAALKWVASHSAGNGPERWINELADPTRIFLAGDSAGANIAHRMGVWSGEEGLPGGVRIKGIVLIHPYFWGEDPIGGEEGLPENARALLAGVWRLAYPSTVGSDDPWLNPEKDPDLGKMGCGKVLICVAGKDPLSYRGRHFYGLLKKSGWVGSVEIFESDGEDHVFFLNSDPTAENSVALLKKVSSFINHD